MMSGGVDSSVAAALLKKRGYDLTGVYMQNWQAEIDNDLCCSWQKDIEDARLVCSLLDIPFYVVDFSKEYKKKVVEYMINGYREGFTPNPDAMCNREIKFGVFFNWAMSRGADYVATGHYARRKAREIGNKQVNYELYAGLDQKKDQSYFLWSLTQKILAKTLFPIGHLTKHQVREIAVRHNLPVAQKKDSQGICFIGKIKLSDFLGNYLKPMPGLIIDSQGTTLGQHKGVYYYTIGQRHGLGIGGGAPLYVAEKNASQNLLVVGKGRNDPILYKNILLATKTNWIGSKPTLPLNCFCRIRYQQPLQSCRVGQIGMDEFKVVFKNYQFAIAPGQCIVFYQKNKVLGGAIIKKAI